MPKYYSRINGFNMPHLPSPTGFCTYSNSRIAPYVLVDSLSGNGVNYRNFFVVEEKDGEVFLSSLPQTKTYSDAERMKIFQDPKPRYDTNPLKVSMSHLVEYNSEDLNYEVGKWL